MTCVWPSAYMISMRWCPVCAFCYASVAMTSNWARTAGNMPRIFIRNLRGGKWLGEVWTGSGRGWASNMEPPFHICLVIYLQYTCIVNVVWSIYKYLYIYIYTFYLHTHIYIYTHDIRMIVYFEYGYLCMSPSRLGLRGEGHGGLVPQAALEMCLCALVSQRIGLREDLQEKIRFSMIFPLNMGFPVNFPLNLSIEALWFCSTAGFSEMDSWRKTLV